LQDYDLGKPEPGPVLRSMELGPRDRLSQAFVHEVEKGRTINTPYGPVVHLDLRHLGAKTIDTKIPFVRELCRKYQNVDPATELVQVRPVVHYMMGGVHTDIDGATPIAGLYAAGEVACVSINGANRLGSNSLPELLVFGARAGQAAAEYAAGRSEPTPHAAIVRDLRGREETRHGSRIGALREAMQHTMEGCAGIYRSGDSLLKAIDTLHELRDRLAGATLDDRSAAFNTELVAYFELSAMLDVAETIVQSALQREESRGAHQRTDHPARDNDRYLAHSLARREADGSCQIDYLPVTITKWPVGERVYGR
jgi:fumarate reductase flavoprotein subunit